MESKTKWIFIGYAVLVLLIPIYMVGSSANILSNGKLYKFRMEGYDPFDFFRGNYLRVNIDTRGIPTDKEDWLPGETVYLSIDVDQDGYAFFDEALEEPPSNGDYMVSRVNRLNGFSRSDTGVFMGDMLGGNGEYRRKTVDVEMPNNLGKYFITEDYAEDGEFALRRARGFATAHVRVKNGNVRLQDIYLGKTRIMEYLEDSGDEDFEERRRDIQFQF